MRNNKSNATKLKRLYWDANIILDLLEPIKSGTAPDILAIIKSTYADMLQFQVKVITSDDLFKIEVLGNRYSKHPIYNQLLACKTFILEPSPPNIMVDIADLRQRVDQAKQSIAMADAMHIATAIYCNVDEFWTTEPKLINKAKLGLFGSLKVCLPQVDQLTLGI